MPKTFQEKDADGGFSFGRGKVEDALQPPSRELPGAASPSLVALPELELRQAGQGEPSSGAKDTPVQITPRRKTYY